MKELTAVTFLALASSTATADYRGEIGALYSKIDGGLLDVDTLAVGGEFHFSSVSTDTHPLAEAAFLERSNNISVAHQIMDQDFLEIESTAATLEFYIPQAMLYLAPFYVHNSLQVENRVNLINGADNEWDSSDWGVSVGLTPIEGLRISTTWTDEVDYEINFDAKYVLKLANDTAVNLEIGYAEGQEDDFTAGDDIVTAGIDYYFDRSFSVGFAVTDHAETEYEIRAQKFFTDYFNVLVAYQNADNVDGWVIGAAFRF